MDINKFIDEIEKGYYDVEEICKVINENHESLTPDIVTVILFRGLGKQKKEDQYNYFQKFTQGIKKNAELYHKIINKIYIIMKMFELTETWLQQQNKPKSGELNADYSLRKMDIQAKSEESPSDVIVFAQTQPRKKTSIPQMQSGLGVISISSKDVLNDYYLFEDGSFDKSVEKQYIQQMEHDTVIKGKKQKNGLFKKIKKLFKDSKYSKKNEPETITSSDDDTIINALNNGINFFKGVKKIICLPSRLKTIFAKIKSSFVKKTAIKEKVDNVFKVVKTRKPKNKIVLSKKVATLSLSLVLLLSSTASAIMQNLKANDNEIAQQPSFTSNDTVFTNDSNKMITDDQNNENEKSNDSVQTNNIQEKETFISIDDVVTVKADYIYTDVYSAKDKVNGLNPYFKNNKQRNVKGVLFTLDGKNIYCTTRDEIKDTIAAGGIAESYVVGDENGFEGAYNAEDVVFVESADGCVFAKTDDAKVLYRM